MWYELADITEVEYRQVAAGAGGVGQRVDRRQRGRRGELHRRGQTAGRNGGVGGAGGGIQRRKRPDPATYIGRGKVEELREVVVATGADTVICDGELAPAQLRNLEDRVKVKVIDRTALILDIFASHAKSAEGKAQVELARCSTSSSGSAAGVATCPARSAGGPAAVSG